MTGLLILTFIPAAAAVLFWLRVRQQRRTIDELMNRLGATDADTTHAHERRLKLLGTVAHELRSPIAAILGYEELLSEGVFGPLDPRAAEALTRMRSSAHQLLTLTDGMQELALEGSAGDVEWDVADFADALRASIDRAAGEAEARRVRLAGPAADVEAVVGQSETRVLDGLLDAVLGAALKTSAERTVRISIHADAHDVRYRFEGTGIDRERVEQQPFASGAGLRIAIAHRLTARLGGTLTLEPAGEDSTTIEISLPRRPQPPSSPAS